MEELDLKSLVNEIPEELNSAEKAIVSNYGTVQSVLSAIFKKQVKVAVEAQFKFYRNLHRKVRFEIDDKTIGTAISIIPTGFNYDLVETLEDSAISLGAALMDYDYKREIIHIFADSETFGRTYRIKGVRRDNEDITVDFLITEIFYRKYFE